MAHRTFLCRLILVAVFGVCSINIFTADSAPSFFLRYSKPSAHAAPHQDIFCPQSEIAEDVLVILRTGATESRQKVPVHFQTSLRCVPNFAIFSDMDEEIEGHAVEDVLGGVSEGMRREHADFELYRQLQTHGRAGIADQKVITAQSGSSKGDYMNTENLGWKLDKWKFLPMIDRAFQRMPTAKWFVFIEADTYLNWNNLLEYLHNFDASKPYYIGKHLYIQDVEFGYGGAGFALSNPAMRKVSEHRSVRVKDYEDFTASHWVGDCALGKVLEDVKVPLHRAFPHFQGDSPATLDPATTKIDRDAWCFPVVTYHHVSPAEIQELWDFEQQWFKRHDILLRHRDIFTQHIRPQISAEKAHWDNMSDQEFAAKSFSACHNICENDKECMQYAYEESNKRCLISHAFRLGYAAPEKEKGKGKEHGEITSGWMVDRVDELFLKLESKCGIRDWFSPKGGSIMHRRKR
ncbi:glycosyltransferase family 31 protein [Amniculicola lignicola CBS 123094]|uniref:N-acetylgalactosaminide beta-1,3-galactosyltransferase n=1 Tax=Amniculicola lignicola CBS 123094 TaxID=1392246 RepID=A0A6A5X2T9_9PLEO|nr:glycosyltransferase family 31 protein [Amniculicola lignicola CBS 123094]